MIGVKSLNSLFKINPNLKGIKEYCREHNVKGFYPFTLETKEKGSDFHARQFNPLIGVDEDPITGVAAGALGAYVVKQKILDKNNFVIEQGYCMGRGGKIYVKINDSVRVGGYAVIFEEKEI
ncbi:MAG: PhzF family phenazine biosynthesis isomerase [Candidatus Moranbacteria bacterium]|nr:PhzF family phenazine biosynthesis isomerase [Candidatus Moranbacteria bacterium]